MTEQMLLPFYPGSHEDAWTRSKLIITQGPRHVCAAISIIIYYYSGSGYISIVYKLHPPVERLGPTTTPHAVFKPGAMPPSFKTRLTPPTVVISLRTLRFSYWLNTVPRVTNAVSLSIACPSLWNRFPLQSTPPSILVVFAHLSLNSNVLPFFSRY